MKTQSPDTHPDIERIQIEAYRKMSFTEKMRCIGEMHSAGRHFALMNMRNRYPHADERELQLRVAALMIDADLMRKAFGWDVEKEGY
jgi:hypothetical protein